MQTIKQNHPIAVRRRIYFTAVSSTALQTRLTGLSGFTVRMQKPGAANAAGLGADPTQLDLTNLPGVYYYEPTVGEIDTAGPGVLRIANTGMEPREIPFQIEPAYFGTAVTGSLTASAFTTSRTESVADFWKDALIMFHTGVLAGQVKKIGAFTVVNGVIALASGYAFTAAPSNGDIFQLINQ